MFIILLRLGCRRCAAPSPRRAPSLCAGGCVRWAWGHVWPVQGIGGLCSLLCGVWKPGPGPGTLLQGLCVPATPVQTRCTGEDTISPPTPSRVLQRGPSQNWALQLLCLGHLVLPRVPVCLFPAAGCLSRAAAASRGVGLPMNTGAVPLHPRCAGDPRDCASRGSTPNGRPTQAESFSPVDRQFNSPGPPVLQLQPCARGCRNPSDVKATLVERLSSSTHPPRS